MAFANVNDEQEESVWAALKNGEYYPIETSHLASNHKRFESEGLCPTLFMGLATSLACLKRFGVREIESRVASLVDYLLRGLAEERIRVLSSTAPNERSGIITAALPQDLSSPQQVGSLETRLHEARITAHIRGGGLRMAVPFFNNEQDIERVVHFLREAWS